MFLLCIVLDYGSSNSIMNTLDVLCSCFSTFYFLHLLLPLRGRSLSITKQKSFIFTQSLKFQQE